ncbi:MAG: ABC transporter substrate-binding protein [Actinomycetota bacterium]
MTACGDDGTDEETADVADEADSDEEDAADEGDSDEQITLTVDVFGAQGFGYEELVEQYMDENPNITVDYQITSDDYDNEYRPNLIQQLDAGNAPDVVGIEEQGVGQMMAMNDAWVDLAEYGLDERESNFPAWKWELGHTNDGKLAGLGTDVGGMAMCYRTDLFEEAGLPTDRDELAELWESWDGYVASAEEFVNSGVDAAFVDSPNQIYNIRLVQEAGAGDGTSYFDRDNNYVAGESPAVQTAFGFVQELHEMGAVGPFENFSEEWNAATAAGGFATMGCPAWMTGVIEGNAGEENAGNWDVTPVPGGGGGNWGGSWLGVPANTEHPAEAAALADFLTSPEGQLGAFEALGNFPSSPVAQEDPAVADATNDYFNDAPTGQIYADSVAAYDPVYFGPLHSVARTAMEDVLLGLVEGSYSSDEAFDAFIDAGREVVELEGGGG